MTDEARASEPANRDSQLLPWADKLLFQKLFSRQAMRSYLYLSFGMGLVAFLLPVALVVASGYRGHYSISFFYHVGDLSRNILVGCLWATGVFLFLYQGLSRWENWILNVAGVAAIGVAMFPMPPEQCGSGSSITLHALSAIVFFVCLAIVAIGFSKTRIQFIIYPPKRRRFKIAYNVAGLAMVAMPAAVFALHVLGGRRCESHWIFWVEVFGIWAFALYWFVKTAEYKILLRVKWLPTEAERRQRAKARARKPA
ncbi:MAG TPA: hypothetical protein VFQ67_01455 [Allosphingosinicella sp.]|jgi:hypothetical protein|nr:hypothetical protein [Allosphingosinicella sp.]